MSRFGFVGPTYTSASPNADCQRCINFYPEANESGMGTSAMILLPTPGLTLFASAATSQQVRGIFTINGRTFCVIDTTLYELLANGTLTLLFSGGNNDGNPVSMVASPQQ